MDMSDPTTIMVVIVVLGIIAAIVLYVFNKRSVIDEDTKRMAVILDPGWQFCSKPTELDPPGTVFRIDEEGRRFKVGDLAVETQKGQEAAGRSIMSGQASVGIMATLFGMDKIGVGAKGKKVERLEFEITDPVKEETSDMALDKVIDPFLEDLSFREDNRYFIIREARMASAMKYFLTEELVNEISGGVPEIENIKVEGEFKKSKEGEYELDQIFDVPLRVMFLPEEIIQLSVGLAQSEADTRLAPVTETLVWEEG